MHGQSVVNVHAPPASASVGRGEFAAAREVELLAQRLGLIDLPMSLHLLQMPRAAPDAARAFARAAAGQGGQGFELAPTAFVLLFVGHDDARQALEGRIARLLGEASSSRVGRVAVLRSLECRSHDVVRGDWLMAELRRRSAQLLRPAA
jgi:hypothetical protein